MESFGVDDCGSVSRSIILLSEDEITKVKLKELFRPITHNIFFLLVILAIKSFV